MVASVLSLCGRWPVAGFPVAPRVMDVLHSQAVFSGQKRLDNTVTSPFTRLTARPLAPSTLKACNFRIGGIEAEWLCGFNLIEQMCNKLETDSAQKRRTTEAARTYMTFRC